MEILKYPDKHLFTPCKEVTVFGPELLVMLDAMWETMIKERGVGLSANQVGIEYCMFTMEGANKEKYYIVNPKIISRSAAPANVKEGCLSAPNEFLILNERSLWVEVVFQNEKGERQRKVFEGIRSVCAQHEMDHLQGKSYLQSKSLSKKQRMNLAKKWGFK